MVRFLRTQTCTFVLTSGSRKCKSYEGFECWHRGHIAICEEKNRIGQPCNQVYTVERGCNKHPYSRGCNKNTQPCLNPHVEFPPKNRIDPSRIVTTPPPLKGPEFDGRYYFRDRLERQARQRAAEQEAKSSTSPTETHQTSADHSAGDQKSVSSASTGTKSEASTSMKPAADSLAPEEESQSRGKRRESYSDVACSTGRSLSSTTNNAVGGH